MLTDRHFLQMADLIATASTCSRLKVGAVIVRERRIISTGYNGAPAGMPHCDPTDPHHLPDFGDKFVDSGCTVAVHAEANAIAFAAKYGISTDKASLYTTDSPCQKCAELIVNSGIKEVIYAREYRITDGLDLLKAAKVHVISANGPGLQTLPSERGDGASLHPSQHADPSFEEGWTAASDARRRGSPRI